MSNFIKIRPFGELICRMRTDGCDEAVTFHNFTKASTNRLCTQMVFIFTLEVALSSNILNFYKVFLSSIR
jgi:hypothetical protein